MVLIAVAGTLALLGPGEASIVVRVSDKGEQTFGPFEAGAGGVLLRLRASARLDGMVFDGVGQRTGECQLRVILPYAEPPAIVSELELKNGQFSVGDLRLYGVRRHS